MCGGQRTTCESKFKVYSSPTLRNNEEKIIIKEVLEKDEVYNWL